MKKISLIILTLLVVFGAYAATASAASFVVDSNLDTPDLVIDGTCDDGAGNCTLRAAIDEANDTVTADTITFNAAMTITLGTGMVITNPVTVDATSVGSCPATLGVKLIGNGSTSVFTLSSGADGTTIRGFSVSNYGTDRGIILSGISGSTTTISCNSIGLSVSGDAAAGGGSGIFMNNSSNIMIGGPSAADRNTIAGNQAVASAEGVMIFTGTIPISDITIQGNYFGVNLAGTSRISNGTSNQGEGIDIYQNSDLSGVTITDNLFVGSGITADSINGLTIQSNTFDINSSGAVFTSGAANTLYPIRLNTGATNVLIGGSGAGEGNVFAGIGNGRAISISAATGVNILGNFFGVFADGNTLALTGNGFANAVINIAGAAANITVGGPNAGEGNIFMNALTGGTVMSVSSVDRLVVQGNRIGITLDGLTTRLGSLGFLFTTATVTNSMIGGFNAGEGNIITGSSIAGIYAVTATSGGLSVVGNTIYNATRAIVFETSTLIGSVATFGAALQNSIYGNTAMGIDIARDTDGNFVADANLGTDANDYLDGDTGPNGFINHPLLISAVQAGSDVTMTYMLDVPVSANPYHIEFFSNPSGLNSTGFGQGEVFEGSDQQTISIAGPQIFTATILNATAADGITATATSCGDVGCTFYTQTSEFSNGITATGAGLDRGTASGSQTSFADNGAYHIIKPGVHLGTLIDSDTVSAADLTDKDGVAFDETTYLPDATVTATITASANGYLNGWFDANADGDFSDAGEHIFTNLSVLTGDTVETFDVPSIEGTYNIRFRYTDYAPTSMQPTGEALSGEVEDYVITVAVPVVTPPTPTPVSTGGGIVSYGKVCNDPKATNFTNGPGYGDASVCIYRNAGSSISVGSGTSFIFTRTLKQGMTGEDVKALQKYLNTHEFPVALSGVGSAGNETTYFGILTKRALIRFQEFKALEILKPLGLTKGTGIFGPATIKAIQ